MTTLKLPQLALVVLIGPSGSGKSTFARRCFAAQEVLSSDFFRGVVRNDENSLEGTLDAFEVLHLVVRKRLAAGLLTVIDATNVQPEARRGLVAIAREFHVLPVAVALDLPVEVCLERNRDRPERPDSAHYVRRQHADMRRSLGGRSGRGLEREGFRIVHVLNDAATIDAIVFEREPLWCDRRGERGPFDIVGDLHGCVDELASLLEQLGWRADDVAGFRHPDGRRVIFLGDLVDRGPRNLDALELVMRMVAHGTALCLPGNHDMKFMRWLRGKQVKVSHGLERTIAEFEALDPARQADVRERVATFIDDLISHLVLDDGRLVVAHAGMKREMQGRGSRAVREFALYGETTGEVDDYGLPVRYDWASEYRGEANVVYGHTPVVEPEWLNRTICIDTGCVFGGKLTALRWPERELVAVEARETYYASAKPLATSDARALSAQQEHDDTLDLADVTGKRVIHTRLRHAITISAEEAAAALEAMSRFAANPKWLVYLPPTMSPSETSEQPGLLEHPLEALAYFRSQGVEQVVCEEKHMGSRAVVVLARDEAAARRRFGVVDDGTGAILTRTGRRFFDEAAVEERVLERLRAALSAAGWWDEFATDWVCLDCELMPWSAKAQELLRQQYAAVGAAARMSVGAGERVFAAAAARGLDVAALLARSRERASDTAAFVDSYRRYCWDVNGIGDLRIAPFHVLASEEHVHVDRDHAWHMQTLARLAERDPNWLVATPWRVVETSNETSCAEAIDWWERLTGAGGEGMVVKPLAFVATARRGLVQPAVKCRGREYLRIIYGPEYTRPEHLERLRQRGLATKRSLALREFALGIEALERFVRREPLRRVHECVFGVLALESDPVDPRL